MDMGGAETLVSQMCQMQREQGHDPLIYAVAALGALGERLRAEGFAVQASVGLHLSDSTQVFFRLFKESRPDTVHIHNPTPTIYAALAARTVGVPSIISTRHSLVAPPHNLVAELKYACAAHFCDWIVGICDATTTNLKSLRSIPARKIARVYNGATPLQPTPKDKWPTKTGFTLLYVGRLQPIKNHSLLLHAFQIALETMPDLRLWTVGDGSEREMLQNLATGLGIAGKVTFWGQQLDVAPFSLPQMHSSCLQSRKDCRYLFASPFSGITGNCDRCWGMAEVARLANAGLIVPPANPSEMAAAILCMARSDEERKQFSRNAEAAFRSRFTLQTMVDAYMDLYRNTPRARRKTAV